jgi:small subunit ribosomal protein S15
MKIAPARKKEIIREHGSSDTDCGSSQVQVALLTERIRSITDHLKTSKKDYAARRGLLMLVGRRARLLKYLQRQDRAEYLRLIAALGLRR